MKAFNSLSIETVKKISDIKGEPNWMLEFRLKSLEKFLELEMPNFGPDLSDLDFEKIDYYVDPKAKKQRSWEEVPAEIKATFDKLGIPEAEKRVLAGVEAQFDSEAIYGSLKKKLEDQGIIFTNIEEGLLRYPDLFKKYFGTLVKVDDNKFSALNGAVWSGGSFLYVPKGVSVELPLQAYFQMGTPNLGQFERTLIIADEGSSVHYVEGCTAPAYSENALHAGVVEVFVGKGASVRYTTIQNWSKNIYNLVTKKAVVGREGRMSWVDGNLGSKVTMKYPACYLEGARSHGEMLSVGVSGAGQEIYAGGRMIHKGVGTSSKIVSKSLVYGGGKGAVAGKVTAGGKSVYQGDLRIEAGAVGARAHIQCDSLIMEEPATADSLPILKVAEPSAVVTHEASATKLEEEKLRYLEGRGLEEGEAVDLIVKGFLDEVIKELPIEYALEFNKLLDVKV